MLLAVQPVVVGGRAGRACVCGVCVSIFALEPCSCPDPPAPRGGALPSCCTPTLDVPQVLVLRAKERNSRRAVIIKFSLRCGRGVELASSH